MPPNTPVGVSLPQSTATVSIAGAASAPTLSAPSWTGGLTSVTANTATLGATMDDNGGAAVTSYGVVWNTTGTPIETDNPKELEPPSAMVRPSLVWLIT